MCSIFNMNTIGSRYISFRHVVIVDIKRRKTRPKVIYQATGMFHISECMMRINLTTNGTNQCFFLLRYRDMCLTLNDAPVK